MPGALIGNGTPPLFGLGCWYRKRRRTEASAGSAILTNGISGECLIQASLVLHSPQQLRGAPLRGKRMQPSQQSDEGCDGR